MYSTRYFGLTACPRLQTPRFHRRRNHGWVWLIVAICVCVAGLLSSLSSIHI